ncbi:hypothetical protein EMCRGX_G032819 [Ephydatia muelleri]
MSKFKSTVETAKGLQLIRETECSGQNFLCYTKFSDADSLWMIGASNGTDVWRVGMTEDEIKDNTQMRPSYLSNVCSTLESGDAQIMKVHNHLLLTLKCGSEQYEFNLYELPATERRKEIEYLLFKLSSQLLFTQKQLKETQDHLQEVLKTTSTSERGAFPDPKNKPAAKVKKLVGHSLVNPNSKKRKTATGVVFGEDS